MGGNERGGTSGVYDDARAPKIENIRKASRRTIQVATDQVVQIDIFKCVEHPIPVLRRPHPDKDACPTTRQLSQYLASALECFPGDLKQKSLLRVNVER